MEFLLWVVLPSVGFALFIGTAMWGSVNHNSATKTSWWACTALSGTLVTIILATSLLLG
jgi:hypothetical protein